MKALSISGNVAALGFTKDQQLVWSGVDMWSLGWKNKMGFANFISKSVMELNGLPDYLVQTGQQISKIVTTNSGQMFFIQEILMEPIKVMLVFIHPAMASIGNCLMMASPVKTMDALKVHWQLMEIKYSWLLKTVWYGSMKTALASVITMRFIKRFPFLCIRILLRICCT